jgi:hypothetical protein
MRWLGEIYPVILIVLGIYFIGDDMFATNEVLPTGFRSLAGAILLASVQIASRLGGRPQA